MNFLRYGLFGFSIKRKTNRSRIIVSFWEPISSLIKRKHFYETASQKWYGYCSRYNNMASTLANPFRSNVEAFYGSIWKTNRNIRVMLILTSYPNIYRTAQTEYFISERLNELKNWYYVAKEVIVAPVTWFLSLVPRLSLRSARLAGSAHQLGIKFNL